MSTVTVPCTNPSCKAKSHILGSQAKNDCDKSRFARENPKYVEEHGFSLPPLSSIDVRPLIGDEGYRGKKLSGETMSIDADYLQPGDVIDTEGMFKVLGTDYRDAKDNERAVVKTRQYRPGKGTTVIETYDNGSFEVPEHGTVRYHPNLDNEGGSVDTDFTPTAEDYQAIRDEAEQFQVYIDDNIAQEVFDSVGGNQVYTYDNVREVGLHLADWDESTYEDYKDQFDNTAEELLSTATGIIRDREGKGSKQNTNKGWDAQSLAYARGQFSEGQGQYLLVNTNFGELLSENCVVIEGDGVREDIYEDSNALKSVIDRDSVPIRELSEASTRYKNPLLVELKTGAITTLDSTYAINTNDVIMPDDIYDGGDFVEWAEENGFPLVDDTPE